MSKHPLVAGMELHAIRNLLIRHENARSQLLLATAIEHFGCPAKEADCLLRKLGNAGYVEWVGRPEGKDWDITDYGMRLIADHLGPRMTRKAVDAIITRVIERARAINADRGRIARVTELRLFGSALDTARADYGDVDIEVRFKIRRTPIDEVAQARAKINTKVPQSWHSNVFLRHRPVETYDHRSAKTALHRGIKGLSLYEDAIEDLGCEDHRSPLA